MVNSLGKDILKWGFKKITEVLESGMGKALSIIVTFIICVSCTVGHDLDKNRKDIQLLSRSVSISKENKEVIIAKGEILTNSNRTESFPIVQIQMYGHNGKEIKRCRFHPEQYLTEETEDKKLMVSNKKYKFYTEINGGSKELESFEFRFF